MHNPRMLQVHHTGLVQTAEGGAASAFAEYCGAMAQPKCQVRYQ